MEISIKTLYNNIRMRYFAWWLNTFGIHADKCLSKQKKELFKDAFGRVLEIGAGTGLNVQYIKHYDDLILLEPNQKFYNQLCRLTHNVHACYAERIDLPDKSVDTVISSMVLCSVQDVNRVFSEVTRVLKPGGTYRLIEHVGAPHGTWLRMFQHFLSPVYQFLGDGCHPDRDIECILARTGMEIVHMEPFVPEIKDPLIHNFVSVILKKSTCN